MSLLERFRDGTEFNSVGRFTLDESKARKKMSRYQLVQVEEFLLLVVQAAVAARCESITIVLEENLIRLEAPGTTLEPEKLARLEDYLFDTSPEAVPYYLIGVAENAVEPYCEGSPEISVKDGLLIFETLTLSVLEDLPPLLRDRLQYINCPVTLNEEALETTPLGGVDQVQMNDAHYSPLTLVRHGVIVARKKLEHILNFAAVVEDDNFTLDASFSDVVEDVNYTAVLNRLNREVNEEYAKFVRAYEAGGPECLNLLKRLTQKLPDPAGKALRKCPLFPQADRAEYCSHEDLQVRIATGRKILVSGMRLNLQLDELVIYESSRIISETLRQLVPSMLLEDADATYRRKLEAQKNRKNWENSPRPTELMPGDYTVRKRVSGESWQAEIGFLPPPGGQSTVDILYQGRLLCSETLAGVPPGSAAVVNLDHATIDELWSRPTGRSYRSTLKELKAKLENLFKSQDLSSPDLLYPTLVDYLFDLLSKKTSPPRVAENAPLFETLDGESISLKELRRLPEVLLGQPTEYAPQLPDEAIPKIVILYSDRVARTLKRRLGHAVVDYRATQERLRLLSIKLGIPKEPVLPAQTCWMKSSSGEDDDFVGEVGLRHSQGKDVEVQLLYKGVTLDTQHVKATRVYQGLAVVDCPHLTPKPDWSGFETDDRYYGLMGSIKTMARELEQSILEMSNIAPDVKLALLHAYPQPRASFEELALFQSTVPTTRYSINELEQELKTHGHLLRGEYGVTLSDRVVVRSKLEKPILMVMTRALGKIVWQEASELVLQREREEGFQSRRVHQEFLTKERAHLQLTAECAKGQISVGCVDNPQADYLDCYVTGRLICRKHGVLPIGCTAALESDQFHLNDAFDDVTIPYSLLNQVILRCARGMLELAGRDRIQERIFALHYFARKDVAKEIRDEFEQIPVFDLQNGGRCSVADLSRTGSSPGYVARAFPESIPGEPLTLRLSVQEQRLFSKIVKRRPHSVESKLRDLQHIRHYQANLPTAIPECFQTTIEGRFIEGVIGISYKDDWVVGQTIEGDPIGYLRPAWLPVVGVIRGAKPRSSKKKHEPEAEIGAHAFSELTTAIDNLYLRWAEDLSHSELDRILRAQALDIINLTKRELGSQKRHTQAKIADTLWDIPLFPRVDGTWVSGATLTEVFYSTEQPLEFTESKRRAPGSALLLGRDSVQYTILHAVFGDKGIHQYEAPPLIDPDQVKENVRQLVAWGLSPFAAARAKLRQAMAEREQEKLQPPSKKSKKPKKSKPKKKKKKKEKVAKLSPEDLFLQQMKDHVRALLGRQHHHRAENFFRGTKVASWVLGPPVYIRENEKGGDVYFNRSHSSIRWLISGEGSKKTQKLCRTLLVIHWVGLVNISSEKLTDEHEGEFLVSLAERTLQTFR